jgi:hypothetical protein
MTKKKRKETVSKRGGVFSNRGRGQIGGLVCDLGSFEKVTIRVVFNGIVWIQWAYGFDASVALCGGHFGGAITI